MAEEFQAAAAICGDNNYWWNINNNNNNININYSARSMFPLMMGSTCSAAANNDAAAGNYSTWQTDDDFMDLKATTRSCSAAAAEDDDSNINFAATSLPFLDPHNNIKVPQQSESAATTDGSILIDSTSLQIMGFGLSSSPSSNWNNNNNNNNHSLFRCDNGRAENNFHHSVLQEETGTIDSCNNNSHQIHSSSSSSCAGQVSTVDGNFKAMMMNQQEFRIDEQSLSSVTSSSAGLPSSGSYGYPSSVMQGLYEPQPQTQNNGLFTNPCVPSYSSSSSSSSSAAANYGTCSSSELSAATWSTTVSSMMKHPKQLSNGLHFSNNTPFWNASADAALHDIRATVFSSSSQPQYQSPSFNDKPNCPSAPLNNNNNKLKREESPEKRTSAGNKSGSEAAAFKRPRIETPSPLPTFKVRKEKLGDRITALQQLVSPFGKTDTASVLHEAIEYIKFLHDQVNVLSTPYLKNGTPIPHHQGVSENMKESSRSSIEEGGKQDQLRRRGLCLVPISSTFPMATETTADFWTPTFGGPLIGGRH